MSRARPTAAGVVLALGFAAAIAAAQSASPTLTSSGRQEITRGNESETNHALQQKASQTRSDQTRSEQVGIADGSVGAHASIRAQAGGSNTRTSPSTSPSTAAKGELDSRIIREFAGTRAVTRPSRDAVIGFSLSTRINEILVRGGQDVAKDQLMVRGDDVEDQAFLDLQEMRANSEVPVLAAKAAMDLSVLELERITKVFQNGGSNQQEFDRAKLTSDRARLDFEAAKESQAQERVGLKARKARVEKLLLRAPFDGQIDSIQGDVGQSVSEQDKVVRVVNVDSLWIDTPAPMSEVETLSLKVGDPAWVLMGAAGVPRIVQGKVIEVAPTTDLSSRSRRIRVELANPKGEGRLIAGDESWTRFKVPTELVIAQVKAAGGTITTSVTAAPDSGVRPE